MKTRNFIKTMKEKINENNQNILSCSEVKYSIISIFNGIKKNAEVYDNFKSLSNYALSFFTVDKRDAVEEQLDNDLKMNGAVKLKVDEHTYLLISCFDSNRK